MKIGVDLKPFYSGSKYRGIGVYTKNILTELMQLHPESEFHFLNLYGEFPSDLPTHNRCFVHSYYNGPTVADCGERNLYRIPELESVRKAQVNSFLRESQIDIMFFPSPNEYGNMYRAEWFQGVRTVAIAYDLIPLQFPEQCLFHPAYKEDYMHSLEFLKKMDCLLAISQTTKDEIVKNLKYPEEKIKVIYCGIDNRFLDVKKLQYPIPKLPFQAGKDYFLFAGGIDFKKNIEAIIRAYSELPHTYRKQTELVIVGKAAADQIKHYYDVAAEYGVKDHVHCVGFVSDEDLVGWYCHAKALVFPSLYEGFGIPVAEAMACETPVITSNTSSLKEIATGHALLVNPNHYKEICNAMRRVLENPEESSTMAANAVEYARSYNWKRVASQASEAFKKLVEDFVPTVQPYRFQAADSILSAIAKEYRNWGIPFTPDVCRRVAEELLALENNVPVPACPCKERVFYDVTIVHEWAKNNYITGIGRVSLRLYSELKRIANVIPVCTEEIDGKFVFHPVNMDTYEVLETAVDLLSGDIYFMPEFQVRGVQIPADYPHPQQLREQGIKTYAVVYDILPLQYPQYFEKKTAKEFHNYLNDILSDYDGILTDSKAVSDDIIEYIKEGHSIQLHHPVKLGYFHNGVDPRREWKENSVVAQSISDFFASEVFLMVGTVEPRKGHEVVLKVFEKLWSEEFQGKLCIIGHVGWNMGKFVGVIKEHKQYGDKLLFLEGASDDVLQYAYKNATALIQASAGEGFGLPLIEAGSYGLPVICSDIPVFHEVAGENAIYFDRSHPETLEKIISEYNDMLERGLVPDSNQIQSVSWRECARRVANVMLGDASWYRELTPEGKLNDVQQQPEIFTSFKCIDNGKTDVNILRKKTILLVHPNNFLQGGQGENNRVLSIVRLLKKLQYEVDVFSFEHFAEHSSYENFEYDNHEGLIRNLYLYDFHKGYKEKRSTHRKRKQNRYLGDWVPQEACNYFEDIIQQCEYDAIGVFYTYLANLLDNSSTSAKKVYFMEDCVFLQQYSWGCDASLGQLLDEEMEKIALFDEIMSISYDEKVMYEKLTGREVHFLPHIMPEGAKWVSTPVKNRKWDIMFLGANNPFNVEGLLWFIDQVYPLLNKNMRIVLVGGATKGLKKIPPKVEVIPFAEDLEEIYNNARVAICPMLRGTGMKIKVVEAMAHGLPVVCNERGIDGFPDKLSSGCLVTNDPQQFADYLNQLHTDSTFYEETEANVRSYFEKLFDTEQYAKMLDYVLENS